MPDLSYLLHSDPRRFDICPGKPTMKAVITTGNGGYHQLAYREVPVPEPGPGELLLRVLAAGVNNTEINTRLGWYSSSVSGSTELAATNASTDQNLEDGGWNEATPFPLIQGTDCCGEVIAMGDGVAGDLVGRRVLVRACMRRYGFDSLENIWMASDFDGAFAQFVKLPAGEVFAIDCAWSDAELATIPCAYGTAENMLHRAAVGAGERVLVTGASGGVGSAVVQLARRRGARVVAVAGKAKIEAVKSLGADRVVERGVPLLDTLGPASVDVVVDNVAGEGFGPLLKTLRRGGRYASSGAIAGAVVNLDMRDLYLSDRNLIGCTAWDEPVFPSLVGYIERGEIRPLLAKTFALEDIVLAQQEFLQKSHFGNFVLLPP